MKTDPQFSSELIAFAMQGGADAAEVYQSAYRMLAADAKARQLDAAENAVSYGYGIRIIVAGRPGFSYSTQKAEGKEVVSSALETARYTQRDDNMVFPEPATVRDLHTFDRRISDVSEGDSIRWALEMEEAALNEDSRIARTRNARASFHVSDVHIANSRGVSSGYQSTRVSAHIMAVAESGGEGQTGWGYFASRHLDNVDFQSVGKEAAQRALSLLGARRIESVKAPVVIDNQVASEFLGVFSSMLSSENVQKGRSLLAGKEGTQVLGDFVDIVDDATLRHAPGMRPVDDEGTPTGRTELIADGVLKGFLYNAKTAQKAGRTSAGNAVRGRYSAVPGVGPLCLLIDTRGKKYELEEMFSEMNRGLYILETMGMHTANPVSGEFSVGVSGIWVEDGKPSRPVKEAAISGNILDFFGRILCLGKNVRFFGSIGAPSLLIGPTDISA